MPTPFSRHFCVLLSAACFWGCQGPNTGDSQNTETADSGTSNQQNVLLIIADDMGVEAHPCYDLGENKALMPHLSALCETGVVFDRAWSNPVCSPTRASILTGRYPHQTGVGAAVGVDERPGLGSNEWTLPRAIAETNDRPKANIGKWHLSDTENGDALSPNLLGWDHYEGLHAGLLENYFSYNETINGVEQGVENYATTETVDDALRWLNQQDEPWLLWMAFNAPHKPFHLPPKPLHTRPSLSGEKQDIQAHPLPYFLSSLEAMDHEIGRLFQELGAEVLANTEIIFLGDNGTDETVSQGVYPPGHAKGSLYQGGIHVPLVISGPSVKEGGRRSKVLTNTNDLFATILDLTDTPWRENKPAEWGGESHSLLPILLSSEPPPFERQWVMAETFTGKTVLQGSRTTQIADHKLIQFTTKPNALFNLSVDPLEERNLLHQPLTKEDQNAYIQLLMRSNTWPADFLNP
jgi:arylsulfatase A-like enzyme